MATTTTTTAPAFRTITARFAGTCKRCKGPITVGQSIRFGGPGRTYHLADACSYVPPASTLSTSAPADYVAAPAAAPVAPVAAVPVAVAVAPAAAAVDDKALMSAAMAGSIAQTFAGLMARPVVLADLEPRQQPPAAVEAPAVAVDVEAPAVVEAPARVPDWQVPGWNDWQGLPAVIRQTEAAAAKAQTAPAARQAALRATISRTPAVQPFDDDDLL